MLVGGSKFCLMLLLKFFSDLLQFQQAMIDSALAKRRFKQLPKLCQRRIGILQPELCNDPQRSGQTGQALFDRDLFDHLHLPLCCVHRLLPVMVITIGSTVDICAHRAGNSYIFQIQHRLRCPHQR